LLGEFAISVWFRFERRKPNLGFFADFRPKPPCTKASSHSRNTLAHANATRPWQIYADFAQHLIGIARPLYATEPFGVELEAAVYAFDASTIDLCLSVFAWAPFRSTKAAGLAALGEKLSASASISGV
jgi:hypothetical protein